MTAIKCLVIVTEYKEGEFGDNIGRFQQTFPALPNEGDIVLLEFSSDGGWTKIWVVIEKRFIGNNFVILGSKFLPERGFEGAWKNYGLDLKIL